jgi:hypothetical protein
MLVKWISSKLSNESFLHFQTLPQCEGSLRFPFGGENWSHSLFKADQI